jgi:hypothetical protein
MPSPRPSGHSIALDRIIGQTLDEEVPQMPPELEVVSAQLVLARLHEVFNHLLLSGAVVVEG